MGSFLLGRRGRCGVALVVTQHAFALGDRVALGDDITGVVEEIIYRRNCVKPLYHICYWANGEQRFVTVPEEDVWERE